MITFDVSASCGPTNPGTLAFPTVRRGLPDRHSSVPAKLLVDLGLVDLGPAQASGPRVPPPFPSDPLCCGACPKPTPVWGEVSHQTGDGACVHLGGLALGRTGGVPRLGGGHVGGGRMGDDSWANQLVGQAQTGGLLGVAG